MDKEKIIIVLLLITIVLSVVSVVVTFSAEPTASQPQEVRNIEEGESSGTASFEIVPSGTAGGGGT